MFFNRSTSRSKANRAARLASLQSDDEEVHYKPIEWPLVKRLIQLLYPFRRQYAMGLSLGVLMVVLEMMSPQYMRHIINYVTDYRAGGGGHDSVAIRHVAIIVLFWGSTLTVALIVQRYNILFMTRAGETVQFQLRKKMFAHLQSLSMSYYDRTKLGRIISHCTSDISSLREVNVWGFQQVIANFLIPMLVAAIMLFFTDWRLFLSVVWLGPLLYWVNNNYRLKIGLMWQSIREHFTRVSTNLAENITGMRVVAAFDRQNANLATFNGLQNTNTSNNIEAGRVNGVFQPLLELIRFVGKVIILTFGAYLIVRGHIGKVGGVVAAYLYWDWFMNPIINFGNFSNQMMMAMAGAERIFALLDREPEVFDLPEAVPLPRITGHVAFDHVTFGYSADRPVLHDVCFEAKPGQTIALVGATGSGKSSIVSLISRFYQPQQGRVLVDGHDIRHVIGKTLNLQTGLVLQANYLFSGTVMENIRYGRDGATDADVIAAAHALGTYAAIAMLKDGFNTEVGERGGSMSLGQRQLICFTRAFLADPRIFMLDEATSAVDTGTEQVVQQSLEKLLAGRTTFIVAHRLSTILNADCILVIDAGRIVERGTHRELLLTGGKYSHLYEQFVRHSN
jgi:ABC-type multidrug transport system fused ATPase/permease subunit